MIDEAGRERYRDEALSLAKALAGADTDEDAVWAVYAGTEKLVAILKFRLDYETPGVTVKLPVATDPGKLLKEARELLSKASEEIARGEVVASIGTLRKARNDLRSYLREKSRSATRSQRKARETSAGLAGSATGR